ncbi:hypothetical protein TRFO_27585 [Tritrichomonas foetus]|uniref:Uncharacterized protein n=1 Tax=Tritrichomonas foetus TaxID=1144522 RepID=A0A1J4K563_9EUKA|nr:hypothetical protein TRFO_27585 [Tritrichomonas foetus]|eukprot:OHT04860.1 hypothetical protein TRFO_27585 [Tritrichomonas foetus]
MSSLAMSPKPPKCPPLSRSPQSARCSMKDPMQHIKQAAYDRQPLPTQSVELLEGLIDTLMDERKQALLEGNLRQAIAALRVIDHTKEYLKIAQKRKFQQMQQDEVNKQNEEVRDRIRRFDEETNERISNLKKQLAKARERLIDDMKKDVQEHEMLWQSEPHRRLYNKPSNELRTLRIQVKKLMSVGRFNDAELVCARADALQAKEQRENTYQMQTDYENATKLLNQKIEDEIHTFDLNAQLQIDSLKARRETQRTVYENQIKKVEQRFEVTKDMDKIWNACQRQRIEEEVYGEGWGANKYPKTSRQLGREIAQPDEILLTIPEVQPKLALVKPIPSADYL